MNLKKLREQPYWRYVAMSSKTIAVGLIILILLAFFGSLAAAPAWNPQKLKPDANTFIYDREGNLIATLHGQENRVPVKLEDISTYVKKAFLAAEDNRFYKHNGIDILAILRALLVDLSKGEREQGGSTITQQLVKNSFLTPEKTLKRKFLEVFLAFKLERKYSKDEIFEMYLNKIYFGHGVYGIESAAKTYFGKDARDLTLGESAMLAGIPRNPTRFSPYNNFKDAKKRQKTVLNLLVKFGYITKKEADAAYKEELKLAGLENRENYAHPYFVDYVIEQAKTEYGFTWEQLYGGGLRIYTTMDPKTQRAMEEIFGDNKYFPPGKPDRIVQGAAVVIEPSSGEIRGLVGGRNYETRRGFNRATALKAQPGSTFKPISVYAPALEKNVSPYTVLVDAPIKGPYSPKNADGIYRGPITMATGVAYSVNVYAVKLLLKIGVHEGYKFAQKLGFKLPKEDNNPSIALGGLTNGVSPLEMARAYSAFANKGVLMETHVITRITDDQGKTLMNIRPKRKVVMKEKTAYIMTQLLEEVIKRGTGTRARINRPAAGKTGTAQLPKTKEFDGLVGVKDIWFVGYTPELVCAVWLGYDPTDREHYLSNTQGGRHPAIIWKEIMSKALEGVPVRDFEKPKNIRGLWVRTKDTTLKKNIKTENIAVETPQAISVKPEPVQVNVYNPQ